MLGSDGMLLVLHHLRSGIGTGVAVSECCPFLIPHQAFPLFRSLRSGAFQERALSGRGPTWFFRAFATTAWATLRVPT